MQDPRQDPSFLILLVRQALVQLAMHAPALIASVTGILVLGLGPLGRGLGDRIRRRRSGEELTDAAGGQLQSQLAELGERLDFIERALVALRSHAPQPPASLPPATPEQRVTTPV